VSRYQKGKTNLDFTEARDSEWPWHQLGHMQVCTSFQADNHASTPPLCFLQAGCPSCRPTNSVKALKAKHGQQHSYKMAAALSWSCEDDSSTDITTGKSDLLFRAGRRCHYCGTLLTDTGRRDDVQQLQRSIFARPASPLLDSLI